MPLYQLINSTNPDVKEYEGKLCTVTGLADDSLKIVIVNTESKILTTPVVEKDSIGDLVIAKTKNSTYMFKRVGYF